MNEDERVARIAAILAQESSGAWRVGIGDDAAVLSAQPGPLVWTVDEQVEDVHFKRAWCSFEDIGFRATMASASDLAAMGATPLGALAALALPPLGDDDIEALVRGQRQACDLLGAPIVGGNLSRAERLSVTTTWLGTCAAPVLRTGARAGQSVLLSGPLGLAATGLRALMAGTTAPDRALCAWRRPVARIAEGRRMAAVASAAIDVSDGLAKDAGRLASASRVRIVLDAAALRARVDPATPLELALVGGEDYALLCTSGEPIEGFIAIGQVVTGEGVVLRESDGAERAVTGGYDHFG